MSTYVFKYRHTLAGDDFLILVCMQTLACIRDCSLTYNVVPRIYYSRAHPTQAFAVVANTADAPSTALTYAFKTTPHGCHQRILTSEYTQPGSAYTTEISTRARETQYLNFRHTIVGDVLNTCLYTEVTTYMRTPFSVLPCIPNIFFLHPPSVDT